MLPAVLRCVECGREIDGDGHGWRAFLAEDPDDPDEPEPVAAVYCPACAEREFGPAR